MQHRMLIRNYSHNTNSYTRSYGTYSPLAFGITRRTFETTEATAGHRAREWQRPRTLYVPERLLRDECLLGRPAGFVVKRLHASSLWL